MTRSPLPSAALLLALALTIPACAADKDLGDTPGDDVTVTTIAPDSTSVTTGGDPAWCPDNPLSNCTGPFYCIDLPCGRLQDPIDAVGCPRLPCGADEPCPEGQVCYRGGDWGECNASGVLCEDEGDECRCSQSLDCQDVAYCVPAEIGPPADCFAITDGQACLAAGCDHASTVIPITFVEDACVCGPPQVVCLWFSKNKFKADSPAPFYRKSTLEVVMLPEAWFKLPHGWEYCSVPGAPAACDCAFDCSF